jgi:hypothetical protein
LVYAVSRYAWRLYENIFLMLAINPFGFGVLFRFVVVGLLALLETAGVQSLRLVAETADMAALRLVAETADMAALRFAAGFPFGFEPVLLFLFGKPTSSMALSRFFSSVFLYKPFG